MQKHLAIFNLECQIQEVMIGEENIVDETEWWSNQLKESIQKFEKPMKMTQDTIMSGKTRKWLMIEKNKRANFWEELKKREK